MKVLFYSIKGGQGKTTHAISYAKHRDCLYVTNDHESGTISIYSDMFAENQLQVIRPEDSIKLPSNLDIVFDFGGWVDERVRKISKICDVVVIPLFYQSMADLLPCIKVVNSISDFNSNIIVLINNTDKQDVEGLYGNLQEKLPDVRLFVVNKSKYIARLANEGKTIADLANESGLNRYMLRNLTKQINTFYSHLDEY